MTRPKKNVKITADVRQKTCRAVKKAYTWSQKMIRILEVNFGENKIVTIQLVLICFPRFEEYWKFMVKKHMVFIGFPAFEDAFEKVQFKILNGAGVLQYVLLIFWAAPPGGANFFGKCKSAIRKKHAPFSWVLNRFQELRTTAPQTYYTFRTSSGASEKPYVLLKLWTPLGFYTRLC